MTFRTELKKVALHAPFNIGSDDAWPMRPIDQTISGLVVSIAIQTILERTTGGLMSSQAVDQERLHRFAIWGELQAYSGARAVAPSILQQLGLYKGQRGIWVHKARTADIMNDGVGVTVGLAHTGTVYDDDLSDEGVIYRYPRTGMPGRDRNEIEATKAASRLGIPVFVIASSPESPSHRQVRLGWVAEWDDRTEQFLVMFGDEPKPTATASDEEDSFSVLDSQHRRKSLVATRSGQTRFRFGVLMRYGPSCAVCRMDVPDVLDTPHIVPVKNRGTNDPRNGLVMCATHHRAFDAHLFGIEPGSLRIRLAADGPDSRRLGIAVASLTGLSRQPHPEAVSWRWDYWQKHARVS